MMKIYSKTHNENPIKQLIMFSAFKFHPCNQDFENRVRVSTRIAYTRRRQRNRRKKKQKRKSSTALSWFAATRITLMLQQRFFQLITTFCVLRTFL